MPYKLSVQATADLKKIYIDSCLQFGDVQADRYHARLTRTFELLADMPELAPERTEASPPLRIFPVGSHLVLYRAQADAVLIVRVLHSRQDWLLRL